jgi:translation initiation factor IF-3
VLVNEQIRAPQVQLITQDGENIGIVTREAALLMAREAGLDLVTLSEDGREGIPVVKLLNVGKDLYEKKKKQAEAKKHQHVVQIKEIKIKPKIGEHDYQTKLKQAVKFLVEGKRLKMTLFFRGRENATKDERGAELFEKINKSFDEAGLGKYLVQERDSREGQTLSRMYHLKGYKAS